MNLRASALFAVSLIIVSTAVISAQTVPTDNEQWRTRCATLLDGRSPANLNSGAFTPQRLEALAEEESHDGQHFVACNLFLSAADGEKAAGNRTQSDTDVSMAKVEARLGAHIKLGFVDKLNRTAEVLDEAEKQIPPITSNEMAAIAAMLPASPAQQKPGAAGAVATPAAVQTPGSSPGTTTASVPTAVASTTPAAAGASAKAGSVPAPAVPANVPTMTAAAKPPSAPDQGESRAGGVGNWSQIDDPYICYYYGYTGGSHYVGGFLWPNLGLVAAGVGLTISGTNGYSSNVGSGTFRFTPMVPGRDTTDKLGTIIFATGSLSGRKALLQTHKQFGHAIIFPAAWKQANGQSDAFNTHDTWCYQKH